MKRDEILEVLGACEVIDGSELLSWTVKENDVCFHINVNDIFHWACADSEEIKTTQDVAALLQAYEDILAIVEHPYSWDVAALYACRRRKMRPQGPAYPNDRALWPLFDACGPERTDTCRPDDYRPEKRFNSRTPAEEVAE